MGDPFYHIVFVCIDVCHSNNWDRIHRWGWIIWQVVRWGVYAVLLRPIIHFRMYANLPEGVDRSSFQEKLRFHLRHLWKVAFPYIYRISVVRIRRSTDSDLYNRHSMGVIWRLKLRTVFEIPGAIRQNGRWPKFAKLNIFGVQHVTWRQITLTSRRSHPLNSWPSATSS